MYNLGFQHDVSLYPISFDLKFEFTLQMKELNINQFQKDMKKQLQLGNAFFIKKKCQPYSKYFLILISFLYASFTLSAQENMSVTGIVKSPDGFAIPGANVIIMGTTTGTITNADGVYQLDNVNGQDTLIISFIGFDDKIIAVNNTKIIDAILESDDFDLGEVVVVGYGTQKKADLTGSVSSIKNEDMVTVAAPNVTSTLTGKVTGVITRQTSGKPGADSPEFTIRGQSTFGDNSALVLVDGIQRDFNQIDPNDIESITVLKDAASAAVYGSRGANGVILVTTKRGTSETPQITFSTSYSSQTPTFQPDYMNAGDYAYYLNEASINKGQNPAFTDEQVQQYQDGTLPSTNWWGEVMSESAPITQYNLSVNGKAKNTKYFISLGHLDQEGLYETASYKRYNLRSNINTKLSEKLSAHMNISLRKDNTNASPTGDYKLNQTLQTAIPTIPAYVPEEFRTPGDELGLNFNGTGGSPIGEAIHSGYNSNERNFIETTMGLNYDFGFVEGLSAFFDYSYDYNTTQGKNFNTPYTLNYYTYDDGLTNTVPSESLIYLNQQNENISQQTIQTGVNYDRSFGEHNLSGLFLYEQMDYDYSYLWAYREGFIAPSIDQLFAGSDVNKNNTGTASENARQGYVGRVNYNYSSRYLFQVNARYDGSYNFPKDKRWGFFPAVSAGWVLSKESFMQNINVISNLKLRGSWGQFGNDRVDPFYYLEGYEFSNGYMVNGTYYTGIMDTGIPNENITWETATSSNIGVDFSLFEGRMFGEFDYFVKNTENILITRSASVPLTFGSELPKENLGVVDNHGVEAILGWKDQVGSFRYQIQGNVTYATSEVIYMDEPAEVDDRLKETGRPFDGLYGYTAMGLFQTQEEIDAWAIQDGNENSSLAPGDIKYFDLNNDSIINDKDRHYLGKGETPELVFGLNANVSYKNFSLVMGFQGASNYTRYLYLNSFEKNYNSYTVLEDSWREGNEGAEYPRLESNGRSANNSHYSSYWMSDGFYIKLRNIQLTYTLQNQPYLSSIGIERVDFSLSGRNVLTIAKKDGFDPEGTNNEYPIMQSISAGLSVVF